jgi:two-component system, OmpR family, response regulator
MGWFVARVLLLEDDPFLGRSIKSRLEEAGLGVTWETTLRQALARNQSEAFEIMLVDLTLPDGNGLQLVDLLRKNGSRIPIIALSEMPDDDTLELAFETGVDDYLKKPFSHRELLARIKAALMEPALRDVQVRVGPVLVLLNQRRIMIDGQDLELKRREFDIFTYLIRHAGTVVSREKIIESLSSNEELDDRTVDSHLSHIRSRLKKSGVSKISIQSVYGVGYRMEVA